MTAHVSGICGPRRGRVTPPPTARRAESAPVNENADKPAVVSVLPDLTGASLRDLGVRRPVLAQVLTRLVDEPPAVSPFASFVDVPDPAP